MKYEALLAHDVSCYATIEIDADSDEAAVAKAMRLLSLEDKGGDIGYDPEWDGLWNERIVHVEKIDVDGTHKCIAEQIERCPNLIADNAFALLSACQAVLVERVAFTLHIEAHAAGCLCGYCQCQRAVALVNGT